MACPSSTVRCPNIGSSARYCSRWSTESSPPTRPSRQSASWYRARDQQSHGARGGRAPGQRGSAISRAGQGTFVAAPRVESLLHLASFTEDMRRRGHKPSTVVLGADESVPPPPARAALGLDVTDRAYRIERLRSADGSPMAHEVSWLPARPLPGLLEHDLSGSVYASHARIRAHSRLGCPDRVGRGRRSTAGQVAQGAPGRTAAGLPADLVRRRSAYGTCDVLVPGGPVPGAHDARSHLSCRVGVCRPQPSVRVP